MTEERCAVSPKRSENFPEWYQQVIKLADMAENSPVRGCMVIKPWGYAIWELIQKELDEKFKESGHKNAYFPMFIPLRCFENEAKHVEGFAKECAVVTHTRLQADSNGKLVPASELEEPLIVRPTSETIIGEMFSKWAKSYRDLPIKINQWANIVRWEMRTRMFLRTTEFLWQEGHTVHSTPEEAVEEARFMLKCYTDFAESFLAMHIIPGMKTESEKFPGAEDTYTIEAMMQDGKALQAGTSHFLGQNFAKSSKIKFINKNGQEEYGWTTSWGVSTRLIGGLIMTHSDDNGLVLPPNVAPVQIVICPIYNEDNRSKVLECCHRLLDELKSRMFDKHPTRIEVDDRDIRGGEKAWEWIKKGVPIRVEIGMREVTSKNVCIYRSDESPKTCKSLGFSEFVNTANDILLDIKNSLFGRAKKFRDDNSKHISSRDEFFDYFKSEHAGFAHAHWCGDPKIEEQIKSELGVSIRCIPISDAQASNSVQGTCIFTGNPSPQEAIFARSY